MRSLQTTGIIHTLAFVRTTSSWRLLRYVPYTHTMCIAMCNFLVCVRADTVPLPLVLQILCCTHSIYTRSTVRSSIRALFFICAFSSTTAR